MPIENCGNYIKSSHEVNINKCDNPERIEMR
jgi:hypothetical protein